MDSFIWLLIFVAAIIGYYRLYKAIFSIRDNAVKQVDFLKNQNDMLLHQNGILLAQLSLLGSLANKAGVSVKEINEVTKEYNIVFE